MNINIKENSTGTNTQLKVQPTTSVDSILEDLSKELSKDLKNYELFKGRIQLEGNQTVGSLGLKENDVLELIETANLIQITCTYEHDNKKSTYTLPPQSKIKVLKEAMSKDFPFEFDLVTPSGVEREEEDYLDESQDFTIVKRSNKGFQLLMFVLIGVGAFLFIMFLISIFHQPVVQKAIQGNDSTLDGEDHGIEEAHDAEAAKAKESAEPKADDAKPEEEQAAFLKTHHLKSQSSGKAKKALRKTQAPPPPHAPEVAPKHEEAPPAEEHHSEEDHSGEDHEGESESEGEGEDSEDEGEGEDHHHHPEENTLLKTSQPEHHEGKPEHHEGQHEHHKGEHDGEHDREHDGEHDGEDDGEDEGEESGSEGEDHEEVAVSFVDTKRDSTDIIENAVVDVAGFDEIAH